MKIAVLTSSRADYGLYLPLLKILKKDPFFDLNIIVFGTHLSARYGNTIDNIIEDSFLISHCIETIPEGDCPADISYSMGKAIISFTDIWQKYSYDLIIALGDRYEMFAACVSSISFSIPIAHIHGGETTLGAIDDVFRHSITHMAKYHFTAAEKYKNRVIELKGSSRGVYNVGALSIENLKSLSLLSLVAFKDKFNIDLSIPSILVTFHPETVAFERNEIYINELISALSSVKDYQIIITMPNADTNGNMIRKKFESFIKENVNAVGIESFGTIGYLTCMKYCSMMLGNTSSGFIEASYFTKYVINLGERQLGRIVTKNIRNVSIEKSKIIDAIEAFKDQHFDGYENIYGEGNTAMKIVSVIKSSR